MTGFIEATVLAATLLAALTWLAVVMFAPRNPLFPTTSPMARMAITRAWLCAPLWVPGVVVLATMIPGLFAAAVGTGDHCEFLLSHHHHLCLLHPPHAMNHWMTWAFPLPLAGIVLLTLGRGLLRSLRERRLAQSLMAISQPSSLGPNVRVLDQDAPLALTIGCHRPTILLSRGLLSAVSSPTLDVILLHERAHMARHDLHWALVDQWLASLLPARVATSLLRQIGLAREQACDSHAASLIGNHHQVARALLEVARLRLSIPAVGLSVVSGSLELRIRHLLDRPHRYPHWPLVVLTLIIVGVFAGSQIVHTIVESTITLLLH